MLFRSDLSFDTIYPSSIKFSYAAVQVLIAIPKCDDKAMYEMARKVGSLTSGLIEAVLFVGPSDPATKMERSGCSFM